MFEFFVVFFFGRDTSRWQMHYLINTLYCISDIRNAAVSVTWLFLKVIRAPTRRVLLYAPMTQCSRTASSGHERDVQSRRVQYFKDWFGSHEIIVYLDIPMEAAAVAATGGGGWSWAGACEVEGCWICCCWALFMLISFSLLWHWLPLFNCWSHSFETWIQKCSDCEWTIFFFVVQSVHQSFDQVFVPNFVPWGFWIEEAIVLLYRLPPGMQPAAEMIE